MGVVRKHFKAALSFGVALWMIGLSSCPSAEETAGIRRGSLRHDGLQRTYFLYVPASLPPGKAVPLVIALHGGRGTSEDMVRLTQGGFNTLADKERFIVVYPDGVQKHWNDGRGVEEYYAHRENIDDIGFIASLIDKLAAELPVDRRRVYATGMSNGAMMSNRIGCELADKIAAIAPVCGAMPEPIAAVCAPARPIPVLAINGTEDPMVVWEGGYTRFGKQKLGKVLSVPGTVKQWAALNDCPQTPYGTGLPDEDRRDRTRTEVATYRPCRERSEVILYGVIGGGHTWPGGWQYLPKLLVGKTSRDFDANEVIWEFFKKHQIR